MKDSVRDCRLIFRFWRASSSLRSRSEKILQVTASKPIGRDKVADGRVEPHSVIMVNKALDESSAVLLGKGTAWPEAVSLEALMPSFDFTVALRVVRRGFDMGQPGQSDKFLKVLGDKLRTVVGDDPREVPGYFSRARCKTISTSSSVIALRNSQCNRKREQPSRTEQR
jgi:hypothetical protein